MRENLQFADRQDLVRGFFTDLRDGAISSGGDIGEALGDAIRNALLNRLTKWSEAAIDNMANIIAKAFSSADGSVASPVDSAASAVTRLLPAANDNVSRLGGLELPSAGATKTGLALSQISAANGMTAKVSSEYAGRFQGLLDDLDKAGYSIRSLGEGGYSYRNVAGTNNLSKHAFGEALDINPRENPWSRRFQTDMPSNINELAQRNGLTWGGTWNKPDTMHFQVDRSANSAALALDKMAGASGDAIKGLDALGGGLGKMGQSLSTSFPAAPTGGGGGGFSSWLMRLFNGPFVPNGAQATLAANGGIGLYSIGGYTGPGGVNEPRGVVHAGEIVWSQADIARNGGVATVDAMRLGRRGYAAGGVVDNRSFVPAAMPRYEAENGGGRRGSRLDGVQVVVNGGSGDEHIRTLVQEGVQRGFGEHADSQRRGNFAAMQRRSSMQKG